MCDARKLVFLYAKECEKDSWRPDDDAKERCRVAANIANKDEGFVIVLGAGCENLCFDRSVNNLSESLRKFLVEELGCSEDRVIMSPKGINTATETMEMVNLIGGISKSDNVIVVSSWYHTPRIMLILLFGFGIWAKFKGTNAPIRAENILHEIFGIPKSVVEILYLKYFKK